MFGKTSAYARNLLNQASAIFNCDTCLSLALVHLDPHCNPHTDPFLSFPALASIFSKEDRDTAASRIVNSFRSCEETRNSVLQRDAAILLTGFDEGTLINGIAFQSAACGNHSYGIFERGDLAILVHEIGHIVGCTHSFSGVMKAILQ